MTGKPFYRIRVLLSEELVNRRTDKKDFNDIAMRFKHGNALLSSKSTLDANYSVKALANTTGSETYKDTDNKKRTNTGAPTGMVEVRGGYRYIKNQKWEPGRSLHLFPRRDNRAGYSKQPNFGWLEDRPDLTPAQYVQAIANKPQIRLRKYKVNAKTNDVIEESEQELDAFSLNGNPTKTNESPNVKKLPGRSIGSRGSSLLQRAAGAFGVIVDAANKFRCPPGTPAANQFTDHMGSNCFGVSASEIVNFAIDAARKIDDNSRFKNNVGKFFEFLSFLDNGGIPGIGRTVWRDENGKRIRNIKKWREVQKTAQGRVFVDGMIRAQDRLKAQDAIISDLMDEIGVIRTPEKMAVNDDIYEAFEKLRATGAWTVDVQNRLSQEDVQAIITARLNTIPGYQKLSPERQQALIKADTERYYATERAILEASLDSFVGDPEHMKSIGVITFRLDPNPPNEAATRVEVLPDTGRLKQILTFDIPEIMRNQEAMLPKLAPNERLRIDVVGAKTDSEAASELTDFLVTVDGYSKQLAAMVEERGFARHIAKHEIAHSIQIRAFQEAIRKRIETDGFIEITGKDGKVRKFSDIKELDGDAIINMMITAGDGMDLESLKNALSRADVVGFLAGDYGKEYFNDIDGPELWAIEATAELHALRDLGLIYGDDIDAALEWMDDYSDAKYITERRISVEEGMEKVKESYYLNLGPDQEMIGNTVAKIRKRESAERKERTQKLKEFADNPATTQIELEEALADNSEFKDFVMGKLDAMDAAGVPKTDPNYIHNREVYEELDSHTRILERAWDKKFGDIGDGSGPKNKKARNKAIDDIREDRGTLDGEKLKQRVNKRELESAKESAKSMDENDIVRQLADLEILLKDVNTSSEERDMIKEKQKIFKSAYKDLLEKSGDTRTWAAQRKELERKVFDIVVPETERIIDRPKKFKSSRSSGIYANQSRQELNSKITQTQSSAIEQIERSLGSDGENVADIGRIMRQSDQVSAIKEINRRHRKAQRGTAEIDGSKVDNASLEQQLENVLIPALEAFEQSEVAESFELDAGVYVDVDDSGNTIVADTIFVPEITKGRIITNDQPHVPGIATYADGEQVQDRWGKSKRQKIVIQVAKGDRAILSRGDDGTGDKEAGYATLPPGMRLRVVDRKEDGTIVTRIERQESITDTLTRTSILINDGDEGPEPWQHAKGTKKKVDRVIGKYMSQRRQNGLDTSPSQPKPSPAIESRNSLAERAVREAGGSFGEPPSIDYVDEVIPETGIDAIGVPQTREQRKVVRAKKIESTVESVKDILSGKQTKEILQDATKDSIDPAVARVVMDSSPEQIAERLQNAAVEFHKDIDKRPRVRMTEGQLDAFVESGEVLPLDTDELSDLMFESGSIGRRLERRMRPKQRVIASNEEFSSGRKKYREQTWQEATAKGATEEFRRLRDSGLKDGKLHDVDDETLLREHGLTRSKQRSVISDSPVYKTDSAQQAIALLALGYEVEVADKGERKMVKNAALQTEAELKKVAAEEADNLGLTGDKKTQYIKNFMDTHDIDLCGLYDKKKNVFCSKHIGVKRENMPQSGGPAKSTNSPAIRALTGGHIGGDYKAKPGLSAEDTQRYKEISDLLSKPKTFSQVSDEDRQWVFNNTDWEKVEVKTEPELMDFLKSVLPDGEKSIVRTSKKPDELYASQKQLRNTQIDQQAENILKQYLAARENWGEPGSKEFMQKRAEFLKSKEAWFQGPILTSRDGYVVDGHHRWAAIKLINDHIPPGEAIDVQVNELQTSIFESLTLAKVFQEHMEIKGKTVGKGIPFEDGDVNPMSKEEFDSHLAKAKQSVQTLAQKIKDEKLYPVSVEDLAERNEPRSPGLKASRDRSVRKYGMTWKPEYSENKTIEQSKSWDGWDEVPLTDVDLNMDILPTESHLKGESIDKVVSGAEPLREGYHPNLVIDIDGKMYISDGHNRVAMNRALGNERIKARVIDLRKVEAPWGKQSKSKTNYKGYDLVEPDNPMPAEGLYPKEVVDAAVNQRESLVEVEKEITKTLIDLSERHNAVMVGLGFRFKAVKSLARKIFDEKGDRTPEQAAAEMSDVIRYTATFEPENYVSGAKSMIEELKQAGYELRVKNYWKAGDPYQGINIAAIHPDGTRFELQFHTPQSATEKEVIHKVYDEYKVETDPKKRWKLYDRMTRMAERINVPVEDGLEEIGEIKTQEFSARRDAPSTPSVKAPSLSSGRNNQTRSTGKKIGGILSSRITDKLVNAALRRSGADEDTKDRVKYGIQLATALAAGGPAGFASALAVDTARRAGREIAERVIEEAVERGHITADAAENAMRQVNRIAPNGLPDEVVDKLADAWSIGSEFLDTRVFTEENSEKIKDIAESASSAIGGAAKRVRGRLRNSLRTQGKNPNTTPNPTPQNEILTEFSSGRNAGNAASKLNMEYQSRIGLAKDMSAFNRPVSGYVVHRSHDEEKKRKVKANGVGNIASDAVFELGDEDIVGDGLTASGEIEVVLRPGVSQRTAYGRGDSLSSAHRPVMMNSTDPDDISDALLNTDGINNKNKDAEAMLHMLKASLDKNYSSVNAGRDENGRMAPVGKIDPSNRPHEPFEAHILGGFKKDEVEGIHYPFTKIQKMAEGEDISDVVNSTSIKGRLEKLGFTPEEIAYFYSISDESAMNTPSMQKLREYRVAKRIKQKYENMGIEYVKIAHPTGVNIENPRTYDKNALGNENVGLMLQRQVIKELDDELKKTLGKMRKPGARELIA